MSEQGGYPVTWFVSDTSNFICRICLEVLKDPHQCKSGHNFCLTCIQSVKPDKRNRKICPLCSANIGLAKIGENLFVKNMVNDLTVHCACQDSSSIADACGWTGPLHKRINRVCEADTTKCKGCGLAVASSELKAHQEDECSLKLVLSCFSDEQRKGDEKKGLLPEMEENTTQEKSHNSLAIAHEDSSAPLYNGERDSFNQRHGTGEMRYSDGSKYSGEWANGSRCGVGVITYLSGETYSGNWADDMRHGHGTEKYANGDLYSGCWCENLRHGQGTQMFAKSGFTFTGLWIKDVPSGGGAITQSDGTIVQLPNESAKAAPSSSPPQLIRKVVKLIDGVYAGDMSDRGRLREGLGEMKYTSGETYSGEWAGDERCGQGVATYPSGEVYEGTWSGDVRDGEGVSTYENGDRFTGQWKYGLRQGPGQTTYATNGITVHGVWVRDQQTGTDKLSYPDGMVYVGKTREFERHGFGEAHYANGDVYTGQWANDKRHGQGMVVLKSGDTITCPWCDDLPHGSGTRRTASGKVLDLVWNRGKQRNPVHDIHGGNICILTPRILDVKRKCNAAANGACGFYGAKQGKYGKK